jgi:hypothetical protein
VGLTREKGEQDLDATIRTRMKEAGAEGSTEARKHGREILWGRCCSQAFQYTSVLAFNVLHIITELPCRQTFPSLLDPHAATHTALAHRQPFSSLRILPSSPRVLTTRETRRA